MQLLLSFRMMISELVILRPIDQEKLSDGTDTCSYETRRQRPQLLDQSFLFP